MFSLNTLISIFCFILIILNACVLLFQLHVEYLTFLILLLYLGGIIIFFLFTTLMLSNEYDSKKNQNYFSIDNILIILIFVKLFFFINIINKKILYYTNTFYNFLIPVNITQNTYSTNFLSSQNDIILFINLYSEKYIFLISLGMILLFTMIGVIVITKNKHA